ncbi:MAG TPA: hypothetical protein VM432_14035 [Bdellovibrionales bacterium]|nr:hypothetical protein [Bdellovibrionales bacterium]
MKVVDQLEAFSPSSQVWLVPDLEHSEWTKKIDWYLNYQIKRSTPHTPALFSKELEEVIARSEFESPTVRLDPQAPMMIACEKLVPAAQTVVVPFKTDADWISTCHRVWVGLARPSVRIFLPRGMTMAGFTKVWPKQDSDGAVEVLTELVP